MDQRDLAGLAGELFEAPISRYRRELAALRRVRPGNFF